MAWKDLIKDKLDPRGFIKDALFTGIGAVSITITYQLFEVLKVHPDLLMKWGPNFVLWLLGITVIGILANQMVDALKSGSESLVASTKAAAEAQITNADGMKQMADAMRQIADQGDKDMREVQAQVAYVAIEMRRVMDRLTDQDAVLQELADYAKKKTEEQEK
jgi:hypothetical protein